MKFKVGDRVKYISFIFGDHSYNPLWGGRHGKVVGTISNIDYEYLVDWDNGHTNTYDDDDLELFADPFIIEVDSIFDDMIDEFNLYMKQENIWKY